MKKAFDCVEMKQKGQEAVRSQTAGMSREQLLEFWKRKTAELRRARGTASNQDRKSA